jgi:pantetheine-phosphate adenylyltransferase
VYPECSIPCHNGHVDVIERSLRIFDEVIVAVVGQSRRSGRSSPLPSGLEMIDEAPPAAQQLRIVAFDGLLIDLVARERADCIVRGHPAPSPTSSTSSRWRS